MDEWDEATEQLRQNLKRIFAQVQIVPDNVISRVHSADYIEDGKTFWLMLDTEDGKTIIVSAEPGKPLGISVHEC